MGKVYDSLQIQLKTEYRKDAEDCIKIWDMLIELNNGHVWGSEWRVLVSATFEGFPSDNRRYNPTKIGYVFLNGIEQKQEEQK